MPGPVAAVTGGTVGLTTVAANVAVVAAKPAGVANAAIIRAWVPGVTGVTAGASVTAQFIRTDTSGIVGVPVTVPNMSASGTVVGPFVLEAPVPVNYNGALQLQMAVSGGTGTVGSGVIITELDVDFILGE